MPDRFLIGRLAGQMHRHHDFWQTIISFSPPPLFRNRGTLRFQVNGSMSTKSTSAPQ